MSTKARTAFSKELRSAIHQDTIVGCDQVVERIQRHRKQLLTADLKRIEAGRNGVATYWGGALDAYDLVVQEGRRCTLLFASMCSKKPRDTKATVLLRLHAHTVTTASEISILLRHGFANGAHARWRSIHESAVVTLFIAKERAEVAIRFLAHEAVKDYEVVTRASEGFERLAVRGASS